MNDQHPIHERPLSNELRSVEAMLAPLVPRGDRLDQEQLWFEAGKRAAMEAMPAPNGRWAIAGSSAISAAVAIAATLLVMLWTQPPTEFVERIPVVEVPIAQSPDQGPNLDTDPPAHPLAEPPTELRDSEQPSTGMARREMTQPRGSRAAQMERMVLLLRHGADYWEPTSGATTAASREASEGAYEPPTYYQQRQDLLDDQASHRSRPTWGGPEGPAASAEAAEGERSHLVTTRVFT